MPYADPEVQREYKKQYRLQHAQENRNYQREWTARRRAEFFEGKCCEACAATTDLVIHHRDPSQKTEHRIWGWAESRRLAELAKCDVLCESCHWDIHREARRLKRSSCGTSASYCRGCRCDPCKAANATYRREWRARRRS